LPKEAILVAAPKTYPGLGMVPEGPPTAPGWTGPARRGWAWLARHSAAVMLALTASGLALGLLLHAAGAGGAGHASWAADAPRRSLPCRRRARPGGVGGWFRSVARPRGAAGFTRRGGGGGSRSGAAGGGGGGGGGRGAPPPPPACAAGGGAGAAPPLPGP